MSRLSAGDEVSVAAYSSTGTSGTIQVGATLSVVALRGAVGPAGPSGTTARTLYAAHFDNPITPDWAVNALAPIQVDPVNSALNIRAFDDTLVEGIGFTSPAAPSLAITLEGRAATAPTGPASVSFRLYARSIQPNLPVSAWSSTTFVLALPQNARYQRTVFDVSSLGLTQDTTQFQLVREGNSLSDTLLGDFFLLGLTLDWG